MHKECAALAFRFHQQIRYYRGFARPAITGADRERMSKKAQQPRRTPAVQCQNDSTNRYLDPDYVFRNFASATSRFDLAHASRQEESSTRW